MATITIKNIPDDLYADLKRLAAANRRSINSQIIVSIEQAVQSAHLETEPALTQIRTLREATAVYPLTDDLLDQATYQPVVMLPLAEYERLRTAVPNPQTWLDNVQQLRARIAGSIGDQPIPASEDVIQQMREQRDPFADLP